MKRQLLQLTQSHWQIMEDHVARLAPEEACGLVGGTGWIVKQVILVENELHSPVRFRMAGRQQLEAFEKLEESGHELVGIFHSHPTGPSWPSPTDVAEAFYPEALTLIWAMLEERWNCRAYIINKGEVIEVGIRVIQAMKGNRRTGVT